MSNENNPVVIDLVVNPVADPDDVEEQPPDVAILPELTGAIDTPSDADGKPPKPIMGAVIALPKDSWSAWTGGKPKADCWWTGLDWIPALSSKRHHQTSSAQFMSPPPKRTTIIAAPV